VNSGNDNLPPSIPPSKGNKPKPNPELDSTKKTRRPQQSGQKGPRQEPVLPEIKSPPVPRPIPPTAQSIPPIPPKPDSFVEQKNLIETPRPRKQPYPFQLVVILLSLLVLGLVAMGAFLIVSPDGRSIRLFPEPTPNRLNLVMPVSQPKPMVKPGPETQKTKEQKT
jgi:hypothetical protein